MNFKEYLKETTEPTGDISKDYNHLIWNLTDKQLARLYRAYYKKSPFKAWGREQIVREILVAFYGKDVVKDYERR